MRIVVCGSTGLIGSALTTHLAAAGHDVVRLVRTAPTGTDVGWDPASGALDAAVIDGADAIVNLSGASIGGHRWTDPYRRTLRDSRTAPTSLLADTIARVGGTGKVLLSGSAIGAYGDRGDEALTEASARGTGFLPDLVAAWEGSTAAAARAGARVVHLRSGIVLDASGGALARMLPPFRFGLGGRYGDGRQWMSWISLDDEVRAIVHLLSSNDEGPVNLTAPHPVRNADFAATLGAVLRRPAVIPVPKFAFRLLLGRDLAENLLFHGQQVVGSALVNAGFRWNHPSLREALLAET